MIYSFNNLLFILLSLASFSILSCTEKPKVEVLISDNIFEEDLFEACHSSSIVDITPNHLIATWFAGSHEGANDVAIWISHFIDNKWSSPTIATKGFDSANVQLPCWNPVLFKAKDNTLYLFYKVGKNPREWWGELIKSKDNGITWTKSELLPEGFLGPIKNKPIQLANGNILCPSSVESLDEKWTVHLEITDENLSTWKKIEIEADSSVKVIQPSIIQHPDGKLQMLCRSNQNSIMQTWSTDNGVSWSKLEPMLLPNPNSGIDAVVLSDGNFVIVYNPLPHGKDWWNGRNLLNVAISKDGRNWKDLYQLEKEKDGEYSYPAIIQTSDKSIHITYTARRKTIKHVVININ